MFSTNKLWNAANQSCSLAAIHRTPHLLFNLLTYSMDSGQFKAAFHLQKNFRGQERNGKFSADRNGKFSVVNFHFFFWRFISNQKVNKDGQIKHNNKKIVHETTNHLGCVNAGLFALSSNRTWMERRFAEILK